MPPKIDFRGEDPDTIWSGDLLDRRVEADALITFLNALGQSPRPNGSDHGYTVAVDAGYGQGKTYFLSRLARQMRSTHLVAYIDAWSDDLANEPLIGLMATLKEALKPVLRKPKVKSAWNKMGRVAKEVGIGLAKKGFTLAITESAMKAISGIFDKFDDELEKDIRKNLNESAGDLVNTHQGVIEIGHFEPQIRAFNDNKLSMSGMKKNLSLIVQNLAFTEYNLPIVIIVDELDRCRPTYAIQLLEEIKHLFDVPGVVFVLGLHGDQLSNAINGAYGSKFDGKDYLKRFINRRYKLSQPSRDSLVRYFLNSTGIIDENFYLPAEIGLNGIGYFDCNVNAIISAYAEIFDLSARDMIEFFDILQSCVQICSENKIVMTLLAPLIIRHILNIHEGTDLTVISGSRSIYFRLSDASIHNYGNLLNMHLNSARQPGNTMVLENDNWISFVVDDASRKADSDENPLSRPSNYQRLVTAVG